MDLAAGIEKEQMDANQFHIKTEHENLFDAEGKVKFNCPALKYCPDDLFNNLPIFDEPIPMYN